PAGSPTATLGVPQYRKRARGCPGLQPIGLGGPGVQDVSPETRAAFPFREVWRPHGGGRKVNGSRSQPKEGSDRVMGIVGSVLFAGMLLTVGLHDLYDREGQRVGWIEVDKAGHVDVYSKLGHRVGTGDTGLVEFLERQGFRLVPVRRVTA